VLHWEEPALGFTQQLPGNKACTITRLSALTGGLWTAKRETMTKLNLQKVPGETSQKGTPGT
jgi:hypothetical protein